MNDWYKKFGLIQKFRFLVLSDDNKAVVARVLEDAFSFEGSGWDHSAKITFHDTREDHKYDFICTLTNHDNGVSIRRYYSEDLGTIHNWNLCRLLIGVVERTRKQNAKDHERLRKEAAENKARDFVEKGFKK